VKGEGRGVFSRDLFHRYLVAPDLEHTMRIADWHRAYPEAKCIGVEGVTEKKPEVKWEGVMGQGGETKTYGFEDEVRALLTNLAKCF
jgi:hypothetical protein